MEHILITVTDLNQLHERLDRIEKKLDKSEVKPESQSGLLDNLELMKLLRVSTRTLQNYRDSGLLPFIKVSRKVYYKKEDVDTFLKRGML